MQAAANAEKYGGSVAKLRAAVVDGKLSSQEFYQAILQGSAELDAKASKATLTLAGAFTALASQLTVYVGEASAANGVTAGLAAAIGLLADNLDTIIPLLAIIGVAIGGRLAAAAIVGGNGLKVLSAYASIATTSLAGTALAAQGAGAALLRALGGPIGLAITGLTLGIGFLVTQTSEAAVAAQANARAQQISADASQSGATAAERLASAHGKARVEALALAKAERENIKQKLASARASLILAQAELARAKAFSAAQNQASIGATTPGGGLFIQGTGDVRKANARQGVADADARIAGLEKGLGAIDAAINAGVAPKISAVGDPGKSKKDRAGRSGPTAEELLFRADSEQRRLDAEVLQAKAQLAVNAEERAEFEKQILEIEKEQRLADLASNKDLTAEQRAAQKEVIDQLYGTSRELDEQGQIVAEGRPSLIAQQINRDKEAELAREAADAAELEKQILLENLGIQYDLATSIKDRQRIALDIIDAEFDARIAYLETAKLQAGISDQKRQQLDAEIALTKIQKGRAQTDAANGNLSPTQQALADINKLNFGDEADKFGVDALKDLNRGLADAIVNGGNLGDVLEDTGKRFLAQLIELTFQLLVIKPLLESLGNGLGGGGAASGIGSIIGGLFGRASGGPVSAGQIYRVNEGVGKEFFRPNTGGDIIPLSKMNAAPSGGGQPATQSVIRLELSGDIQAQMTEIAAGVSVEVMRAAEPSLTNKAVNETFRRGQRRSIGG